MNARLFVRACMFLLSCYVTEEEDSYASNMKLLHDFKFSWGSRFYGEVFRVVTPCSNLAGYQPFGELVGVCLFFFVVVF
jgi:hypothetical protein